jgi:hypothetical protein
MFNRYNITALWGLSIEIGYRCQVTGHRKMQRQLPAVSF